MAVKKIESKKIYIYIEELEHHLRARLRTGKKTSLALLIATETSSLDRNYM